MDVQDVTVHRSLFYRTQRQGKHLLLPDRVTVQLYKIVDLEAFIKKKVLLQLTKKLQSTDFSLFLSKPIFFMEIFIIANILKR